jgi:hypothetical protein
MIAMALENKLMKLTNAKIAMVRKSSKKRKSLRLQLIRVHHMERNTFSMVNQMNILRKNQVMLSLLSMRPLMQSTRERVQIF